MVLDQLGEIVLGNASRPRLFQSLFAADSRFFALRLLAHAINQVLQVDSVVPDIERLHECIISHLLAIGLHRGAGRPHRLVLSQTKVTSSHDHARGQALQVPFPWCGQGRGH
jgi:hypothetical protein